MLYGVFPGVVDGLTAIKCVELAATGMKAQEIVDTIEQDFFDKCEAIFRHFCFVFPAATNQNFLPFLFSEDAVTVSFSTPKNLIRGGRIKLGPLGPPVAASGFLSP